MATKTDTTLAVEPFSAADWSGKVEDILPSRSAMSDQEIRARALECAVGVAGLVANTHPSNPMSEFWSLAQQFEAYIRDGVT